MKPVMQADRVRDSVEALDDLNDDELKFFAHRLVCRSDTEAVLKSGLSSNRSTAESWSPSRKKRKQAFAEAYRVFQEDRRFFQRELFRRYREVLLIKAQAVLPDLIESRDKRVSVAAAKLASQLLIYP